MADQQNVIIDDRGVDFILYEAVRAQRLLELPAFADHGRETFDIFLGTTRRFAREVLFPAYRPMDAEPPVFSAGRVKVHPRMHELYPKLVGLGILDATRPITASGQQLPLTISVMALAYLMGANLSAVGYLFLTTGAANLIERSGARRRSRRTSSRCTAAPGRGRWRSQSRRRAAACPTSRRPPRPLRAAIT